MEKNETIVVSSNSKSQTIDKPGAIPWELRHYLVTEKGLDPGWLCNLKCVKQPKENSKGAFDIRIFSLKEAGKHGVKVTDYNSLNNHMDLILLAGWYETFKDNSYLCVFR